MPILLAFANPYDAMDNLTSRPASRRALADLQYNSILADQATSSDDESPGSREMRGEEARTAIGVSIGREQTRFTSARTPAAEKTAAIDREGGFFGAALDGSIEGLSETLDDDDGEGEERESKGLNETIPGPATSRSPSRPAERPPQHIRKPSPWRVPDLRHLGSQRSSKTKAILHNGFFGRKRSWSGPDSWLPSLPKGFNMTSPFSSSREAPKEAGQSASSPRRSTLGSASATTSQNVTIAQQGPSAAGEHGEPTKESEEAQATVGSLPTNSQLQRIKSSTARPPALRRSTSDNSLITQRTLSRVSSLGDDTRFEHIQEQV